MGEKAQDYVKNYFDLKNRSFNLFELIEEIKKIIYPFEEILKSNQKEQESFVNDLEFKTDLKNIYLQEVLLKELE
ncbi:MAG: hypothetical protein EU550_03015 [Promethearchaeota archaeon]|nr:MAG: hypothetical protein EU550_03015 [Candidatus Lokiarchaeota archaeon]